MEILADVQGSGDRDTLQTAESPAVTCQRALQSPALALGSIFVGLVTLPKEPDEQAPATRAAPT